MHRPYKMWKFDAKFRQGKIIREGGTIFVLSKKYWKTVVLFYLVIILDRHQKWRDVSGPSPMHQPQQQQQQSLKRHHHHRCVGLHIRPATINPIAQPSQILNHLISFGINIMMINRHRFYWSIHTVAYRSRLKIAAQKVLSIVRTTRKLWMLNHFQYQSG